MSAEIKEINNSLPNVKELLQSGNIEMALNWVQINSQEVVEEKKQELAGMFEMSEFVLTLNEEQTQWLDAIFAQFLIPQNNIA